jgi:hypothetical protein
VLATGKKKRHDFGKRAEQLSCSSRKLLGWKNPLPPAPPTTTVPNTIAPVANTLPLPPVARLDSPKPPAAPTIQASTRRILPSQVDEYRRNPASLRGQRFFCSETIAKHDLRNCGPQETIRLQVVGFLWLDEGDFLMVCLDGHHIPDIRPMNEVLDMIANSVVSEE